MDNSFWLAILGLFGWLGLVVMILKFLAAGIGKGDDEQ